MGIPETLLLQLTRLNGWPVTDRGTVRLAVAAGALLELELAGRIAPAGRAAPAGRIAPAGRADLQIVDPAPSGEEILDRTMATLLSKAGESGTVNVVRARLMPKLGSGLVAALYPRLAAAGIVEHRPARLFGLFASEHWPLADLDLHRGQYQLLAATLRAEISPTELTGGVLTILRSVDALHAVFGATEGMSPAELNARADATGPAQWAPHLARQTVAHDDQMTLLSVGMLYLAVLAGSSGSEAAGMDGGGGGADGGAA